MEKRYRNCGSAVPFASFVWQTWQRLFWVVLSNPKRSQLAHQSIWFFVTSNPFLLTFSYCQFFIFCVAMVQRLSMRTHNTRVVSSIPPCVTMKPLLVRRAKGNHLIKSTTLQKNSEPCLWFPLSSKLSMQRSFLILDVWEFCALLCGMKHGRNFRHSQGKSVATFPSIQFLKITVDSLIQPS